MRLFKSAAAAALRGAETCGFLDLIERRGGSRGGELRILTYHRVAEPGDRRFYPGLISATPRAFERQMRCLARRYRVVSLGEVLDCRRAGSPLPPRGLLLTFDDAYADFAEHAWPILARLGLPATLFVPTAYPDRPRMTFWWDRLYRAIHATEREACQSTPLGRLELSDDASRGRAFRRLRLLVKSLPHERAMQVVDEAVRELGEFAAPNPVLGWDALRSLAREGVALCAHTRSHPQMDRISGARIREEIAGSLADLRREIGDVPPVFAYPDGRFSADVVEALAREGVEMAFTTRRGLNDMDAADPLLLRRIAVGPSSTEPVLRAQLLGWPAFWRRSVPVPPSHPAVVDSRP